MLFAIGSEYRKLQISGEHDFRGKGVSYCATCDAPFFRDKRVCVVGGGNSAVSAALLLAKYAKEVIIFYRGEHLKANPASLEQISQHPSIHVVCGTNLRSIIGDGVVTGIEIDTPYEDKTHLEMDGVFIEISSEPNVDLIQPLGVLVNDQHFVITKPDQSTNLEGLYAAGDITTNSNGVRQIITAASEGAVATWAIYEKLKQSPEKPS